MNEQDEIKRIKLEKLRAEVKLGIEASERGEVIEGRKAMAQIKEELIGNTTS